MSDFFCEICRTKTRVASTTAFASGGDSVVFVVVQCKPGETRAVFGRTAINIVLEAVK